MILLGVPNITAQGWVKGSQTSEFGLAVREISLIIALLIITNAM